MSYWLSLLQARHDLIEGGIHEMAPTLQFFRSKNIKRAEEFNNCIGALSVTRIVDCGNHRFDFAKDGFQAVVCEALAEDAETVIDLVAWPLDKPAHVLTMFGKCGVLGIHDALNPSTYCMGDPLEMYRTPLELFQAGFVGATIVTPSIAARQMLDFGGQIASRDYQHGQKLERLMQSVVPKNKILVPQSHIRRVA